MISILVLSTSNANISVDVAPNEITLGGLFPLTGALSGGGVERDATFRMAINEINHRSDILPNTVLKYEIRDTGTNPTTGANAAQQLVTAGVFGVVGAAASSVSMAVAPILEVAKIPQISYSSTNPDLSNKTEYPYFMRVVPSDSIQSQALAHIIYNDLGNSTVATISSTSDYANWTMSTFENEFSALGGTVSTSQKFIIGASDVTTQLQAIFNSGTKMIVLASYSNEATTVFSQTNSVGINATSGFQWLGTDGLNVGGLLGNPTVATAMEGLIGTQIALGSGDLFVHYKDMWECGDPAIYAGAGDRTPNAFATFAYDAVYAFAWAAHEIIDHQDGDITDGANLLQLLQGITYQGATGPVSFDENQDRDGIFSIMNVDSGSYNNVALWSIKGGLYQFGTITLSNGTVIPGTGDPDPSLDPPGHVADCSLFDFNEGTYVTPTTTLEVTTETAIVTVTQIPTDVPTTEFHTATEIHTTESILTVTESANTVTVSETIATDYTSTTVVTNQKSEVPLPIGFVLLALSVVVFVYHKK